MNTTNGRIADQSKKKIADALLVVMQQYDYIEITITQLAQEAETFVHLDKMSLKNFYQKNYLIKGITKQENGSLII